MMERKDTDTQTLVNFIVPDIIANGEAFAMISSFKGLRQELYEIIKLNLTIHYKENTYTKYFLYATDYKNGGIPHNQNFKTICAVLEFSLVKVLMKLSGDTQDQRTDLLIDWWGQRNLKTLTINAINAILKPYIDNLEQNENEQ